MIATIWDSSWKYSTATRKTVQDEPEKIDTPSVVSIPALSYLIEDFCLAPFLEEPLDRMRPCKTLTRTGPSTRSS
jgi:hypothetical protein